LKFIVGSFLFEKIVSSQSKLKEAAEKVATLLAIIIADQLQTLASILVNIKISEE